MALQYSPTFHSYLIHRDPNDTDFETRQIIATHLLLVLIAPFPASSDATQKTQEESEGDSFVGPDG